MQCVGFSVYQRFLISSFCFASPVSSAEHQLAFACIACLNSVLFLNLTFNFPSIPSLGSIFCFFSPVPVLRAVPHLLPIQLIVCGVILFFFSIFHFCPPAFNCNSSKNVPSVLLS